MVKIIMKWTRCNTHGETKGHNFICRKPLSIGPLGISRRRWENDIKIGLKEMGRETQWK
jgi:hypothetical protein